MRIVASPPIRTMLETAHDDAIVHAPRMQVNRGDTFVHPAVSSGFLFL